MTVTVQLSLNGTPVPQTFYSSIESLEVGESYEGPDVLVLRLPVNRTSAGDLQYVGDGTFEPYTGISTVVTIDPDSGDTNTQTNPQTLRWGGSVQYSMPYLKSNVVDLGISDFFNRMIFIVEASMQTPLANARLALRSPGRVSVSATIFRRTGP